ncbi:MAG: permease-like cell division protein FtsX [Nitriliruptorales bacterium]|nr:permease-like cell division protein FtsX [Nitriliruptorales bacterium]
MSARWRYIAQEALVGLRRNLMMTVAVILSVAVSLTLLGAALLLMDQVRLVTGEWTGKIEVSIFLCDGGTCPAISPEQQEELRQALEDEPIVKEVFYESKQQAYENFREQFADQPDLVESVTPDALPASFRVKLQDPERVDVIQSRFEAWPGVEEIVDQREIVDSFLSFANAIRNSAFGIAIIQLVAASVLIANTIRVAAFARREQTSIMKLVGASNWYVRLPFVFEGVIAGALGAVVATGILAIGVPLVTGFLKENINFITAFVGRPEVFAVSPLLFLTGIGIAAISSLLALRRFLDV